RYVHSVVVFYLGLGDTTRYINKARLCSHASRTGPMLDFRSSCSSEGGQIVCISATQGVSHHCQLPSKDLGKGERILKTVYPATIRGEHFSYRRLTGSPVCSLNVTLRGR